MGTLIKNLVAGCAVAGVLATSGGVVSADGNDDRDLDDIIDDIEQSEAGIAIENFILAATDTTDTTGGNDDRDLDDIIDDIEQSVGGIAFDDFVSRRTGFWTK